MAGVPGCLLQQGICSIWMLPSFLMISARKERVYLENTSGQQRWLKIQDSLSLYLISAAQWAGLRTLVQSEKLNRNLNNLGFLAMMSFMC